MSAPLSFVEEDWARAPRPGPRPYQLSAAWLDVCARTLGARFHRRRIERGGRPVGEFTYAVFISPLFGRRLISMPFSDGGGLLLDADAEPGLRADLPRALDAFVDAESARLGLDYAELRGGGLGAPEPGPGFARVEPYVTFLLDLRGGYERVRAGYGGNILENLRKADRRVEVAEEAAFGADQYRIYLSQMRKFGAPPLPSAYFSDLRAAGLARLFEARVDGRPAGFLFTFVQGRTMLAEINASPAELDAFFPKVRLFDHAIRAACAEGFETFDFMRTRRGSGVHAHKKKWGGSERAIPYFFRARGGLVPEVSDPEQARYRLARLIFRCAPPPLAARVGPALRGWIGK